MVTSKWLPEKAILALASRVLSPVTKGTYDRVAMWAYNEVIASASSSFIYPHWMSEV